jgi:hypothetical protein
VCEIDEGKTFDNMVGEYICGVITSQLTPKDTQVEIVTPTGYCTTLDTALTYQIDWVIDDLELSAKLRRKDGLHLRTAPPDNPLSRRVWRLDNALMIQTLVQEVNDSVTVSTSPLIKTRKVMSSV